MPISSKFQLSLVVYFRSFSTEFWAHDFLKLSTEIEQLIGIEWTGIFYSYESERPFHSHSKEYNIVRKRRERVLRNFEQVVNVQKMRTVCLQNTITERERICGEGIVAEIKKTILKSRPYHTIYVQIPERISQFHGSETSHKFITSVFEAINRYFKIEYGLSGYYQTRFSPVSYFADMRPHHIAESMFVNLNLWHYNGDKMPYKLRDIYMANVMTKEHIQQLGGHEQAMSDLRTLLNNDQIYEIERDKILFFVDEAQKAVVRHYFEQKEVLLTGEPPTKWFMGDSVVRGE
ncbi:MAG: hypothetical protein KIH69_019420 [Anaerolineae bacterium]|nr:hypothetical protein [Anaerolineae bacterium]